MRNTVMTPTGLPVDIGTDDAAAGLYVFKDQEILISAFSAALTAGALLGALIAGPLADQIGRRLALMLNSPLGVVAYLIIGLSSDVYLLITARFMAGLPVGIGPSVASVYISEVAPTRLRGILGACNEMASVLGISAVYAAGLIFRTDGGSSDPLASDDTFCDWRLTSYVCVVPCALLAVVMYFAMESPIWLASRKHIIEAQNVLCKLRGCQSAGDYRIASEMSELTNTDHDTTRIAVRLRELFTCRKQLIVAIVIQALTQLSGLDVIAFYLVTIFQDAHLSCPDLMAVTVQLASALAIVPACLLVERSGRRPLLLVSSICMCISLSLIGVSFYIGEESLAWLSVVGAYGYNLGYALGVGPIRWLLVAEIFPNRSRSLAVGLATMASWLTLFIVILVVDYAIEATSRQAVFWFFSGVSAVITVFVWFTVPETKGKSFEEIKRVFYPMSTDISAI
ncbi:Arabinose-proton symporter, putative [Perkinsus marinus ATCC 50983]|uniref:Hexose transporter 1 n=1 Tax=Perkinsus marinus (strain ATCC 50983 / TXsc) TaxID=423536 RepID=C5LNI6_PERM5|nr:Arabinose-proton symporter, putative [Perkinsus marinus ATCC 50983]EER01737.1 Arabinose-proton symporter, putative [Perkinsus marinus ATCC 50983]|eukprot:XP_002769019.1 Arabinose-proton symporter, putative [Perkinsus marinus ATCC 50983]